MSLAALKALTFDVFGTVVDWRGSIVRELAALALPVDPARFADAWRAGYQPAMQTVRDGRSPWAPLDILHRRILDSLLEDFHLSHLPESQKAHLNRVWHRLDPWPDAAPGLALLRRQYICATLSNGNVSLLVDLARHGNLPFDCILSAELYRAYKPDPAVYLGAAATLDCAPGEVLMVAAHQSDLLAAHRLGLKTAFVERPLEHGPDGPAETGREDWYDLYAHDFIDLARQLQTIP